MSEWQVAYLKAKQRFLQYLERRHPFVLIGLRRLKGERCQLLPLEYPVDNSWPRYGYGKPPLSPVLAIIELGRERYRTRLREFARASEWLKSVPYLSNERGHDPYWLNTWFTGLDALSLYSFLASLNPRLYVEIGSGHSTRFARRAIRDQGLRTHILSIDPSPRTAVDELCNERVRQRLEDLDLSIFERLRPGDILFFDGSHRCFVNTDVTVFFLEVLPRVPYGVLVHIHDIYLPFDYPVGNLYYNEQYLLAVYLIASATTEILMPNAFVAADRELVGEIKTPWQKANLSDVPLNGSSFWFMTASQMMTSQVDR